MFEVSLLVVPIPMNSPGATFRAPAFMLDVLNRQAGKRTSNGRAKRDALFVFVRATHEA